MAGNDPSQVVQDSIQLDAVDDAGIPRKVNLRARIIGPGPEVMRIRKQEQDAVLDSPSSHADDEDKYTNLLGRKVISPPINLTKLTITKDESTELGQSINAMVTNTVGFGWQLKERRIPDEIRARLGAQIEQEYNLLKMHLETVHPIHDFIDLRERVADDKHSCGNGYLERIVNQRGELVGLEHVHGHTIRLTTKDRQPTKVMVPRIRPDQNYKIEQVPMWYRFRKFGQVREDDSVVWFKEAGDPRTLNKETGNFHSAPNEIPFRDRATSLIHFAIYHATTPYGVPIWIGDSLALRGSRAAEEINWATINNNNIPSMVVVVENGRLTDGSIDRLREWTERHIATTQNYSTFLILEGEALDDGAPNPANFRIRIEPLKSVQQKDELFQEYQENNASRVRQAFRLPPIFVGRCHSADTEYLTRRGWKVYEDIGEGEEVATMNPATGALEFQTPTARHSYPFDGAMIHLRNRGLDALITQNHRLRTRATTAKARADKPWMLVEASELTGVVGCNGGCVELPVSCSWEGEELATFSIPRNDGAASWTPDKPTKNPARDVERYASRAAYEVAGDAFVEFLGYFVSEGSTTETPGPITLSQNAGPVAESMCRVIQLLGFEPGIAESRPGELNISFSHVGLWTWLREYCGTSSDTKRLPWDALDLAQRQLELLLDRMVEGDGSRPLLGSEGSFTYSTTSKILNDQLHVICLKLGIAMTSRLVDRSERGWKGLWRSYGHYATRHLLHKTEQVREVPYSGQVSCFTVPNGLLVTRRNGRVLISGNSDDYTRATADTSRDIADEQIFAPERRRDDNLINRFILAEWGARFHTFKSNHPNITDDIELIRLMAIAERSGAMTPRRADSIIRDVFGDNIGPVPTGIDLDKPFSITFAEAQGGGAVSGAAAPGGDTARRVVDSLVDMRQKIEKELDRRFYAEEEE